MQSISIPDYIGLCGNPMCGKSTAQQILQARFGHQPVDDGEVLRQFCIDNLGMSRDDVYTQEGKAGYVEILGQQWQRRDVLGSLGKQLEDMFGEYIMPHIALQRCIKGKRYSFGSVRKVQGHYLKRQGALIIAINNPDAPPSPYAFDWFDPSAVDVWINNDALANGATKLEAMDDLRDKLVRVLEVYAGH